MLALQTLYFENLCVGLTERFSKTVASSDVVGFAEVTGDRNPIHLSEHFAAKTPFGTIKGSTPAKNKCPRKHKRKLSTILSQIRALPVEDRLEFIANLDDFPLAVIPSDIIEPCLTVTHLLESDVHERLLRRLDPRNTGVWKILRKRLGL